MPSVEPLLLLNPGRRPAGDGARPASAALTGLHRRLPGYAVTPVVDAPDLAAELGAAALTIKDESRRLQMPSFKILGASWAVYRLLVSRLAREPEWRDLGELRAALAPLGSLTLAAATDGNHGRAVAHMARLLGYESRILVPAGTARARIEGIASEGASVTVVDGTYDDAVRASAALATDTVLVVSDTSWEGYTEVPRTVIEGYGTIFAEVDEQLAHAPPEVVVVPMGVGALAAAVVDHYVARAKIFVVEPLDAACGLHSAAAGRPVVVPGPHHSIMAGLNCGTVSVVAWPAVSRGVDVFVAVGDDDAERAMRDLANIGIVAGETGAAALGRAPGDRPRPARRPARPERARVVHRGRDRPGRVRAHRRPRGLTPRREARARGVDAVASGCHTPWMDSNPPATSPKVYMAGPLGFTAAGRLYHETVLEPAVRASGLTPLDPWAVGPEVQAVLELAVGSAERAARLPEVNRAIGARNARLIEECDAVLAVLDGNDVDSGTAAEIGYAAAKHKPVVGLRCDHRVTGDNEATLVNLQVEWFVVESGGRLETDLADAIASLARVTGTGRA